MVRASVFNASPAATFHHAHGSLPSATTHRSCPPSCCARRRQRLRPASSARASPDADRIILIAGDAFMFTMLPTMTAMSATFR